MSKLQAYLQLLRLPNVFTALADISLGAVAAGVLPDKILAFSCLLASSACFYSGGMVWNDYFDLEQDRRERPTRPLPSGRISPREAVRIGSTLFAAGWFFAFLAGLANADRTPVLLALGLIGAILLYDGILKRTWAGPLGMGACRFLNVLLGWCVAEPTSWPWSIRMLTALVVGVYVIGVTWFARTEALVSRRSTLTGAAVVMLAGICLALLLPMLAGVVIPSFEVFPYFPYVLASHGLLVGVQVCRALADPSPCRVQGAVRSAVLGLILLDAALASIWAGLMGLALITLLIPALFLGRWLYST